MPINPKMLAELIKETVKAENMPKTAGELSEFVEDTYGVEISPAESKALWAEFTNQSQTPAASAAASPASLFGTTRTATPDNATVERSLLDDTNIILDDLKQRALLLANDPHLDGFNNYSSIADDKKYLASTKVSITIQESGHDRKRFYAIGKLIESFVSAIREQKPNERLLVLPCENASKHFAVMAHHSPEAMRQKNKTPLMAPIASFPFDDVMTALNHAVEQLFSNWHQDANDSDVLFIKCDEHNMQGQINSFLYTFQDAYQEIDKKFDLERNNDVRQQTIVVNKEAMNQLSRLITGKDLIIEPSLQERPAISPR